MTAVLVGFPILKDARRFHVQKGRRWTVFEHLVLEALAKKDWAIGELVAESDLPRRIVIEILIRLMRAGWVHLVANDEKVFFAATAHGRLYATRQDLPPITRPVSRFISYTMDTITGSVFRVRDLTPATEEQWQRRSIGRPSARIFAPVDSKITLPDVRLLADTVLDADEELIRVEMQDWRPRHRIGVVTVRGDAIEGLGAPPSQQLRTVILSAARKAQQIEATVEPIAVTVAQLPFHSRTVWRPIHIRDDDLVLGAEAHRSVIADLLSRARHRVLIHSTFVSVERGRAIIELLKTPLQRGAVIDIMWGQSSERAGVNATRHATAELRAELEQQGLADRIRIHASSTRSHAKILLCDTGDPARFVSVVGSCNWMYTNFDSFEASVRLRDGGIVADVAFQLAELCRPRDAQIPDLSVELFRLGKSLELSTQPTGRATARLILGSDHAQCLLDARDGASSRIVVLSHQLGSKAKPALTSLIAAVRSTSSVEAFYGQLAESVDSAAAFEDILHRRADGLEVRAIQRPRLHAKLLAWDNDDLVLTSQNWLSADPSDSEPRQEIGVHIKSAGLARTAIERFKIARDFA